MSWLVYLRDISIRVLSEHRPYVGLAMALLRGNVNVDSASAIELSGFDTLSGRTALNCITNVAGLH
jgi:hypothetical protein